MRISAHRLFSFLLHSNRAKHYSSSRRNGFGRYFQLQPRRMSTGGTATALLTATVAHAPRRGAEPEEAKDLRHHLKDGKGFVNPWDSWRELDTLTILWGLLKSVRSLIEVVSPEVLTALEQAEVHGPGERAQDGASDGDRTEAGPPRGAIRLRKPSGDMARSRLLPRRVPRWIPRALRPRLHCPLQPLLDAGAEALHRPAVRD